MDRSVVRIWPWDNTYKVDQGTGAWKANGTDQLWTLRNKFHVDLSTCAEEERAPQISQKFLDSPWYVDIIYVLRNLQAPPKLSKTKAIFLKLKETKFCMVNQSLYWKDPRGILLSCLMKEEAEDTIRDFHKGDCGGPHYRKTIMHNILRAGFYWPNIFFYVYKEVSRCHDY